MPTREHDQQALRDMTEREPNPRRPAEEILAAIAAEVEALDAEVEALGRSRFWTLDAKVELLLTKTSASMDAIRGILNHD